MTQKSISALCGDCETRLIGDNHGDAGSTIRLTTHQDCLIPIQLPSYHSTYSDTTHTVEGLHMQILYRW